jgi:hypothetical protein
VGSSSYLTDPIQDGLSWWIYNLSQQGESMRGESREKMEEYRSNTAGGRELFSWIGSCAKNELGIEEGSDSYFEGGGDCNVINSPLRVEEQSRAMGVLKETDVDWRKMSSTNYSHLVSNHTETCDHYLKTKNSLQQEYWRSSMKKDEVKLLSYILGFRDPPFPEFSTRGFYSVFLMILKFSKHLKCHLIGQTVEKVLGEGV